MELVCQWDKVSILKKKKFHNLAYGTQMYFICVAGNSPADKYMVSSCELFTSLGLVLYAYALVYSWTGMHKELRLNH